MKRVLILISMVCVIFLSGCSSIFGCDDKTETLEAIYSSGFYEIQLDLVQGWRDRGYDCQSVAIRNAFGTAIGDRYTCTACE